MKLDFLPADDLDSGRSLAGRLRIFCCRRYLYGQKLFQRELGQVGLCGPDILAGKTEQD
jgi:hypothetical protein